MAVLGDTASFIFPAYDVSVDVLQEQEGDSLSVAK